MTGIHIEKQSVLIIEDESTQRRLLQEQLESLDLQVLTAGNGEEGLKLWRENPETRIVITDIEMPEIDGFEVIKTIRETETEYTYLMVLTILNDKEALLKGLALGVDDYVHKPVVRQELAFRLKAANRLLRLKDHDRLVVGLANLAAIRSGELSVHLNRMKEYVATIGADLRKHHPELGLTEELVEDIANTSVMHDLGKISIPESLLHKRGKYSPKEREIIKEHTIRGSEIFKDLQQGAGSSFLKIGYQIVLAHHEKWDGSGYPYGLKGEEIPLPARIVALADTYDSVRSPKPYKDPFPAAYAESVITEEARKHFDPILVESFIRNKDVFAAIHDNHPE